MSDADLRDLERRAAATGDPADKGALNDARRRLGLPVGWCGRAWHPPFDPVKAWTVKWGTGSVYCALVCPRCGAETRTCEASARDQETAPIDEKTRWLPDAIRFATTRGGGGRS